MSVTSPPVPGSLRLLMDGLYAAQQAVLTHPLLDGLEPLTAYRWRDDAPDAPAMWNWLTAATSTQMDTARRRDSFAIETRIGVNPRDGGERLAELELYVDAYRFTMDPTYRDEVHAPPLLEGGARWAERTSMASFSEEFGGMVLTGIAFAQRFDVDRPV